MAAQDGARERRRTRSLDERKRIVEEALAPGVSVAAVARRHGLNANLVFKWIRRSREGWRDRRRELAKDKPVVVSPPERDGGPAFVPVKLLELDTPSAPPRSDVMAKPARQTRRGARRGAMEISLPNGAKVSLDADVDAEALRRVLLALGVA
jgi:transposase